ncbi:MAG TPA: type II secretory pathway protein [Verrucomicrobiales bacterium]|nr:type II secretory pathway protein [Verrucomicrobiales bacterium]HRJ08717.1 type II secretion system F family protein [Prosthecobacter sp.]HRK15209.1 type II secretion system F family protein [Prosthecobacter sp.]
MPTFAYSAHSPSGVITGELSAADRAEAISLLGRKKLRPFKLEQSGAQSVREAAAASAQSAPQGPLKIKIAQVTHFIEELSDLLSAGIQLEPALATMERRRELSGIKTLATALRAKVRDGMPFSKAVSTTTPSFGNLFCALASAGEASGTLPSVLKRQAAYMRSLLALRSKVAFALIYPAFLIVSAVAVTLLFIVYLIPKLTELLDATGGSLPLGAQIILKLSELFKATWWMAGGGLFAAWLLLKAWLSQPASRIPWARFLLRLPLFGGVLKARFHVQFLETLANLLGNGLPLVHAMQLTHQAIENPFYQREFEGVMRHVAEGVSLSRALARSPHFPDLLIDIVSVGEQTGDLAAALGKAAERFDRELTKKVEKLSALVQPLIVCLMAGMVGIMAYLMITTIFQTISGMSQ